MEQKPKKKSRTSTAVKNRWNNAHYERITVTFPIADDIRNRIRAILPDGDKLNTYLVRAVEDRLSQDEHQDEKK